MSLRALAEADLAFILEDKVSGFGWDISVTDPGGNNADVVGSSGDIGIMLDQETGMSVAGRQAHVSIRLSSLEAKGLGIPFKQTDSTKKPWVFTFKDTLGVSRTFAVDEAMPDRTIGVVTCTLSLYRV
jgi:hypothetical protein